MCLASGKNTGCNKGASNYGHARLAHPEQFFAHSGHDLIPLFGFLALGGCSLGVGLFLCRPVVQVVSRVVALTTVRELFVNRLGVGQAMAVGALGHHLVLVLMAGYAGNVLVLGFAGFQQTVG